MNGHGQPVQYAGPHGDEPAPAGMASPPPAHGRTAGGWTVGRIIAVVAGSLLLFFSLGVLGTGALLVVVDQTQRTDGYLPITQGAYSTSGYALVSEKIALHSGWEFLEPLLGQIRVEVVSTGPAKQVFVAIAKTPQVSRLLGHTAYTVISRSGVAGSHQGHAAPGPPKAAGIWAAQVQGTGAQTLTWTPDTGDWTVVVMNADGSAGLTVRGSASISAPMLLAGAVELLVTGVLLGAFAAALIWVPVKLASGAGRTGTTASGPEN